MAEQPPAKCFDNRPVPPLGYCAECLRGGIWMRAATIWKGTALCAEDLLGSAGASEGVEDQVSENDRETRSPYMVARDQLLRGMSRGGVSAGF